MYRFNKSIWFSLFLTTAFAHGQNTFPATGNVGIGTTAPTAILDVTGGEGVPASNGNMNTGLILSDSPHGVGINLGVVNTDNSQTGYGWISAAYANNANVFQRLALQPNGGNVGIGTIGPSVPLEISTTTAGNPSVLKAVRTGGNISGEGPVFEFDDFSDLDPQGHIYTSMTYLGANSMTSAKLILGSHGNASGTSTSSNDELTLFGGNVGIGTTSPQAKLELNGNLRFTADGSVQTTAWTGVLCGGDYAESVDVAGDRTKYGPGDVLVIDPDDSGKFFKSGEPYSTAVLGIYSTKPGAIGRRQNNPKSSDEVPMAMIGIVPTKVSAENGPIKPGDLLVTSSTPGYAMKGTDRRRLVGAVIGKALGRLDSGTGVIEVGVTLQ